jgi:hypothetical protein
LVSVVSVDVVVAAEVVPVVAPVVELDAEVGEVGEVASHEPPSSRQPEPRMTIPESR